MFHNTTVNDEPLSPSIFEKITSHCNKYICLIWVLCVCVYFIFLYCCWFSSTPLWAISMLCVVDIPKPKSPKTQVFKQRRRRNSRRNNNLSLLLLCVPYHTIPYIHMGFEFNAFMHTYLLSYLLNGIYLNVPNCSQMLLILSDAPKCSQMHPNVSNCP